MASFPPPPPPGNPSTNLESSHPPVTATENHPLAQASDGVELAGRSLSYSTSLVMATPRAPLQFSPAPQQSQVAQPNISFIPPPLESPTTTTRTLDDFVDQFLTSGDDETTTVSPTDNKLYLEPLPTDVSDYERLKILIARRAYIEVAALSSRLLTGPNSHYAPIWQSLLQGGNESMLALESQQEELIQIAMYRMDALLKLKSYNELQKEIDNWTFVPFRGNNQDCPKWVPWAFHIAVAACLHYMDSSSTNKSLDMLYSIQADTPQDDYMSLVRVNQVICNIFCRQKQWRMALSALQRMLEYISGACRQQHPSSSLEDVLVFEAAYSCQILWRQARILLQVGATDAASTILHQALTLWNSQSSSAQAAPKSIVIASVPAILAMNDGLVAFAKKQYDSALESFRKAVQHTKPLLAESALSMERVDILSGENGLMIESPYQMYSNCVNNMALCAIYTCRLHEAIHMMETLIRESPTDFLTERVALNLCTLYELQCDSTVAARKKRVLQLLAKRFTLQDIGADCFRLQQ